MDPVSLALAVAPLLLECGKLVKDCNEMKNKYQTAQNTLNSIVAECNGISSLLVKVQALTQYKKAIGVQEQTSFYESIEVIVAGSCDVLNGLHQHLGKVCQTTESALLSPLRQLGRRDRLRVVLDEEYVDRQLQRLNRFQTTLNTNFSMLILDRQSDDEIRQMVEMQGTVLTTILERSRNQSRVPKRSETQNTDSLANRQSVVSTSSTVISETEFEFDENIVNSRVYRQAFNRRLRGLISRPIPQEEGKEAASLRAVASLADGDSYLDQVPTDDAISEATVPVPAAAVELSAEERPGVATTVQTSADDSLLVHTQSWEEYVGAVSAAFDVLEVRDAQEEVIRDGSDQFTTAPMLASKAEALLVSKGRVDALQFSEALGAEMSTSSSTTSETQSKPVEPTPDAHFGDRTTDAAVTDGVPAAKPSAERQVSARRGALGGPKRQTGVNRDRPSQNLKLVVVGDGGNLKTRLLTAWVYGTKEMIYVPSVFENYMVAVAIGKTQYDISVWDTAGQDDYDRLRPLSYPGTDVFVMCAPLNNETPFESIKTKWMPEVAHFNDKNAPIILVGVKPERVRKSRDGVERVMQHNDSSISKVRQGRAAVKSMGAHMYLECDMNDKNTVQAVFGEAIIAAIASSQQKKKKAPSGLRRLLFSSNRDLDAVVEEENENDDKDT